jgi:adenylate cyclase
MTGEWGERRLAAILAVAGYGRLMGQHEAGTLARLRACCRELVARKIAEHTGRIVKTTGDGILIECRAVEAVASTVAVEKAMAEQNAGIPAENRIEFRVGINLRDAIAGLRPSLPPAVAH